jgi:tetratricopeptide (TPR) repeat protein
MRRIVLSMVILLGGGMQAGPLRAGVYNLDPPLRFPSNSARKNPGDYLRLDSGEAIRRVLVELGGLRAVHDAANLGANVPVEAKGMTLRGAYEKQLAGLEARQRDGMLTPADRVNLGDCLIRMGRLTQARALLEESLRVVPPDSSVYFLLLLNLASAYQEDNALLQRAIDLQTQALRSWPKLFPGWNRWESVWYRRAEHYALTLMRLRQREQIRNPGRYANELPPLDELFGKVRFVGASGQYEAGGIAFDQWELLPADAEQIVLQLLFWRPLDPRLNWLYGELLNARGQVDWAFSVLDYCTQLASNRELRQHSVVLRESLNAYKELFVDNAGLGEDRRKQALLLWSVAPRGALLAPTIGAAANECGGLATCDLALRSMRDPLPAPPRNEGGQGADAPRSGFVLPDWRQLTVSFLTGVVVAVLGVFQWQQWRRSGGRQPPQTGETQGTDVPRSDAAEHFAPK